MARWRSCAMRAISSDDKSLMSRKRDVTPIDRAAPPGTPADSPRRSRLLSSATSSSAVHSCFVVIGPSGGLCERGLLFERRRDPGLVGVDADINAAIAAHVLGQGRSPRRDAGEEPLAGRV